jgi:hypothetical protein
MPTSRRRDQRSARSHLMSTRRRQSGDPTLKGPCETPLVSKPTRKVFVNWKMRKGGNERDKRRHLSRKNTGARMVNQ